MVLGLLRGTQLFIGRWNFYRKTRAPSPVHTLFLWMNIQIVLGNEVITQMSENHARGLTGYHHSLHCYNTTMQYNGLTFARCCSPNSSPSCARALRNLPTGHSGRSNCTICWNILSVKNAAYQLDKRSFVRIILCCCIAKIFSSS